MVVSNLCNACVCIITNTGTELKLVERSDCIVQWLLQNQRTQEFRLPGTKFLHFKFTASIWKLKHNNITCILNLLVFVVLEQDPVPLH